MMWGPYGYGTAWWMPFMGIFWFLALLLLVAALMGVFRRHGAFSGWYDRGRGTSAGLAILEERYARGEINREEYLQKKKDILARS